MIYNSQIDGFQTLMQTFFTMFRAMLGDVPLDEMYYMRPALTPLAFMLYCTITLFTVFTILIAVISDAYQTVIDDVEGQAKKRHCAYALLPRCLVSAGLRASRLRA